jgi:cyclase
LQILRIDLFFCKYKTIPTRHFLKETTMMKHTLLAASLAAALFSQGAPAAEPVWDGNTVNMVSETLSPGVYAFYPSDAKALNAKGAAAATSGGLIVGTQGALLIDTMLNQRLNQQVQDLSRKLSKMPLRYAINTSAHGDHSYGNMYLPASTTIIQHVNTRTFVDKHLADDKAFMIQNFGTGRGIEEIKARTGDLLVPAGGKITVDVIDFGFAQTGGDLWVWEPQSKVTWSGNPVIASQPALPWLLDGHLVASLETLRKVHDFCPATLASCLATACLSPVKRCNGTSTT